MVTSAPESLSVSISSELRPEIRWAPDFGVGWLHVGRRDKNQIVWEMWDGDSTNSIRPPVRYGILPNGAIEMEPPVSLEPGVEYEVSLGRFTHDRPFGRVLMQVARVKFTP